MHAGHAAYRIPKQRIPVELRLDGEARSIDLHVAHGESLIDMIEAAGPFLPAIERERGTSILVATSSIVWVELPARITESDDGVELALFENDVQVRVRCRGGLVLDGHIVYSAPEERNRLLDHLNQPERFLRVWRGGALHLVAKAHIVHVEER